MKRIINYFIISCLSFCLMGCAIANAPKKTIEIEEMKNIAELATVECYFHNVAKSDKDLNPAWYEVWKKKNMRFWVEYDGIVTIGLDASKINVAVTEDNIVQITLPQPKVINSKVDENSLNESSFYFDPNAAKPSPEEQSEAFKEAQLEMEELASNNNSLKNSAKQNAKELLKNYVDSIGESLGIEYKIEWIELEESNPTENSEPEPSPESNG